jgi:hypothetical protein
MTGSFVAAFCDVRGSAALAWGHAERRGSQPGHQGPCRTPVGIPMRELQRQRHQP